MKKTLKRCLYIILAVLALSIFGIGVYLSLNVSKLVKTAVETYAPKATGTKVELGSVYFIFLSGRVGLNDLVVHNPKGFKTPYAFEMSNLVLQIAPSSLQEDVIVIDEFTVSGANITAEQAGTSLKTNLQVIADYASSQSRSGKKVKTKSNADGKPLRLVVKRFNFVNNSVDLVSEHWGDRTIKIPDLRLSDIGKKERGLTPEQLSQRMMELISKQASDAVRNELVKIAEEKAKDTLTGKIKGKLGSLFGSD